jgi:NAD(P)-dependent dehydrogenase (short-subunit alcohol dehydrogenase family)
VACFHFANSHMTLISLKLTLSGCIINVASLLGLKGGSGSAGYAESKAGVIGKRWSALDTSFTQV